MANFGTERLYQNFEPATRWTSESDAEVLIADLPGFKKEQLKVAVTITRKVRLTGERPTGGNKWIRFHQEIPVPLHVDIDSISAMFKDDKLYIRHPKVKKEITLTKPPTPVIMKPHNAEGTVEKPSGGKIEQLKHNAQQKADEVKSGIKELVGETKGHITKPRDTIEKPPGGKIEQLKHNAEQKAKEVQSGIKELVGETRGDKTKTSGGKTEELKHNAEQKAREAQSGVKKLFGEAKGHLSSKDEEKDKVGAKWFEKYKEATGNVVKEAKNKRQLLGNLAASVILVLLILLYARNAIRSSVCGGDLRNE